MAEPALAGGSHTPVGQTMEEPTTIARDHATTDREPTAKGWSA